MELDTYKTVTFKDRMMKALEQIRAVDKKIEERLPLFHSPNIVFPLSSRTFRMLEAGDKKLLKECQEELRDCQDTLLTLHKEILFYVSG